MPVRATKRGDERTPLDGSHDVLICGASFAGLTIARELAGLGRRRADRRSLRDRRAPDLRLRDPDRVAAAARPDGQPSASASTRWSCTPRTASARYRLPWTFSTFDYRELCELLWRDCDAGFETAKVNGRVESCRIATEATTRRGDRGRDRPRRRSPRRWSSTRSAGGACSPPATATSRPTRRSRAASRCTRAAAARTSRSGSTAATCRPATAGRSRPATSCGSGSAPSTRASTSRRRPSCWPRTSAATGSATRATGSRTSCAARPRAASSSSATPPGHCLPLTAEGIRTALYFGIALGRELRAVVEERQSREQAAAAYAEFHDSHEWKFRWMLRVQRLVPRIPPRILGPAIRLMGSRRFVDWSFGHYLHIAPPEFAGSPQRTTRTVPTRSRSDAEQALGA